MKVSGTYVGVGLVATALLAGLVFWWYQNHAFYKETHQDTVTIAGVVYPVTEWKGIVSSKSPLSMRACFLLREDFQALEAVDAKPLVAPGWFRCFNARVIDENLERGYARAYVAGRNEPPGFDRIIAVFPGGRSYMWRQPSANTGILE
jgi:hypothetical protein